MVPGDCSKSWSVPPLLAREHCTIRLSGIRPPPPPQSLLQQEEVEALYTIRPSESNRVMFSLSLCTERERALEVRSQRQGMKKERERRKSQGASEDVKGNLQEAGGGKVIEVW